MRRAARLLALLLCALAAPASASDDPAIEARVDATRIGEGDSVTLTIALEGRTIGIVEEPDLSGLADFTIVAGPSVSTSTSMVWRGGQATSSTSRQYAYVLMPRRRGTLTIPTVTVRVGNRSLRTDPVSIEVVEGRIRGAGSGRGRPGGRRPPAREEGEIEGDLIVESIVDKRRAWVGEQILVTYRVLTQVPLADVPTPQQLPSYTGFWVEEIPNDPRQTLRRVTRDGREYEEFILMKKALFPTTSGRLRIDSTAFGFPVKVRSRDPFDAIFFTPTRMVYRQTQPLTIDVRPLPEEGRPASYRGAVGDYALSVTTDRKETRVNEAIGVQVRVQGRGNIRVIGDPVLPPLPEYRSYEPKVEEHREVKKDVLHGSRTWDYVLTPLAPGRQDIPPIHFSWFDPAAGAYVERRSDPIPIEVARAAPPGPGGAPALRREVTEVGRDIRYIKPVEALEPAGTPYHRSVGFAAALAAPVLIHAALLVLVQRRRHRERHGALVRRKRAPAMVRRRLKQAREHLAAGDATRFHEETARAMNAYLGDTLGTPAAGLTRDALDALLQREGLEEALRADLARVLDRCDEARFAPGGTPREAMIRLLDEAGGLIARLDHAIGRRRR